MQERSWIELGILLPKVLLPRKHETLEKWCVIACDQYTSDRDYWNCVKKAIGEVPSTLSMILPEVYLQDADVDERIESVGIAMEQMQIGGELEELPQGLMLIERTFVCHGRTRTGLLMALDLERYDYAPDAKTLIRATEGTIPSRIPPRLRIREKAQLEFPHIMVLIDDPTHSVIKPLLINKDKLEKMYDSDLGFQLGHIKGYFVDVQQAEQVKTALSRLLDALETPSQGDPMLFAMGDGNHSFATAKALWAKTRETLSKEERLTHPARFALCEVVNVHDEGLEFEAIHRVAFHVAWEGFWDVCQQAKTQGIDVRMDAFEGAARVEVVHRGEHFSLYLRDASGKIAAGTVDTLLELLSQKTPGMEVDYIHGDNQVEALCQRGNNLGFLLPVISKSELFPQVSLHGPLPRKAFSMGEADEKRCYLEGRVIVRV